MLVFFAMAVLVGFTAGFATCCALCAAHDPDECARHAVR